LGLRINPAIRWSSASVEIGYRLARSTNPDTGIADGSVMIILEWRSQARAYPNGFSGWKQFCNTRGAIYTLVFDRLGTWGKLTDRDVEIAVNRSSFRWPRETSKRDIGEEQADACREAEHRQNSSACQSLAQRSLRIPLIDNDTIDLRQQVLPHVSQHPLLKLRHGIGITAPRRANSQAAYHRLHIPQALIALDKLLYERPHRRPGFSWAELSMDALRELVEALPRDPAKSAAEDFLG
jgi:hypothetical protein